MNHSRITGTGSDLPPNRVSNEALAERLAADGIETSSQWIIERTGIRARHFAAPDVVCSDLALAAAQRALEAADCDAASIDLIIVATSTPDMVFPSTACLLQQKLGVHGCPAFDVQAVCSGFIYALTLADSLIRTGTATKALVVGAEIFSRILDFKDRSTCVLFGDGAGAVVLEASKTPGILASELCADGRHAGILCVPGTVSGGQVLGDPLLKMDGPAVFKLAVGVLDTVARSVLEKAGRSSADVDWLIHRKKAEAAARKADRHRRRARQHLGRIGAAGARCGGAWRQGPPRRHGAARRCRWRLHLGRGAARFLSDAASSCLH